MFLDRVRAVGQEHADATAVVYADERVTYGELVDRVDRLAAGLADRGTRPGDTVGIVMPATADFIVAYLAVTALGAAAAPLNPQGKPEELEFQLGRCRATSLITDDARLEVCAPITAAWARNTGTVVAGDPRDDVDTIAQLIAEHEPVALPSRDPSEGFVVQFSSGSSGRPKRVVRTHGNIDAEAGYLTPALGLVPGESVFVPVPLFHSYGACALSATFASGATLLLLEDPNPFVLQRGRAIDLIEAERPAVFIGVPYMYRLLAEAPREADLSSLRLCTTAGVPTPKPVFDAFAERFGIPMRQIFGTTETGPAAGNVGSRIAPFDSAGRPFAGIEISVLGEDGSPLPAGQIGDLAVASPGMAAGYPDNPKESAESFRDGRFFTGDLARIDEDGQLFITGRKKLLIPVGGFKVDPIEVEDVLNQHPAVAEAVVLGVPDAEPGEEMVKAAIVLSGECTERDIILYARRRLSNHKVPRIVEFREEIPRSPVGKVLRQYLIDPVS